MVFICLGFILASNQLDYLSAEGDLALICKRAVFPLVAQAERSNWAAATRIVVLIQDAVTYAFVTRGKGSGLVGDIDDCND